MNEQRVFTVTAVDELVPTTPGPEGFGLWKVTCEDPHTTERLVIETCQPPVVGADLFVDVVLHGTPAAVGF